MPVDPHGLKVLAGEERLEAALYLTHGALGLLEEGLELLHEGDGIGDVVTKRDIEPADRVHVDLDNLVADAHSTHMQVIVVDTVDGDVDDIHGLAGVLILDGDELFYCGEFACLAFYIKEIFK